MEGLAKRLGEMVFNADMNWFPPVMAAASRAIRERLSLVDFVLEVRDARIPLASGNEDLRHILSIKRHFIVFNKMDLANSDIISKWMQHFKQCEQSCYFVNAHNKDSMKKLLHYMEAKLKEAILNQPTLLVMVVGIPNVGKSAVINSLHQIGRTHFPAQEKLKRANVGPMAGVTQDIKGFKIGHRPSIYALDTPGVLAHNIPDVETGLKLALTGALKDSIVGEDHLARYLLAMLNTCGAPLNWKHLDVEDSEEPSDLWLEDPSYDTPEISVDEMRKRKKERRHFSDHTQDHVVRDVRKALFRTFSEFNGNPENEDDLESLIDTQFMALRRAFRIPLSDKVGQNKVAAKVLNLYRTGRLGHYTLDMLPESAPLINGTRDNLDVYGDKHNAAMVMMEE